MSNLPHDCPLSLHLLQDLAYASFLFNKLQRLQLPRRVRHTSIEAHCDVCGASFQQLRQLALQRALGISGEMAPRPATPSAAPISESSWVCNELPVKQQRWKHEEQQQEGGAPWRSSIVQSTYLGGGGAKGLATVTPLPLNPAQNLEGVWRVSCCTPELRNSAVSTLFS